MIRSAHHADFDLDRLLERKDRSVTAVLPARECAATVGLAVRILGLNGLVDQVLVIDANSADGTAGLASAAGAEVAQEDALVPELGPAIGKGDAMWRALSVARGDLVVYLDADTPGFSPAFVTGLLGPLLTDPSAQFTKATYRRPFHAADGSVLPGGGGRVSQLTARPLLGAFYPDLAGLSQPLSGEVAGARALFERVPFSTGYAVETAMLLDLRELIGASAMVEVDLGERLNAHQSLEALRPMADAVLASVTERLRRDGRLVDPPAGAGVVRRPPFASLRGAAA